MKFAGLFSLSVFAGVMLSGGAALADARQDEAYKKAEAAAKSRIDTWAQEIEAAAKSGKPHEEVVKSMGASSQKVEDELKAANQTYDCKDADQAKRVEDYIHQ